MKNVKALSPSLLRALVPTQDIKAIYGKPKSIKLYTCNGSPVTTFTFYDIDERSGVQATLWYPSLGLSKYEGQEIVFYASQRRGISIVKSAGGSSWLWITESAAVFPKEMFKDHMATKKTEVYFT
jgi:hypothetical protein